MEKHVNLLAALQLGFRLLGLVIAGIFFVLLHFIGDLTGEHEPQMILSIIANVLIIVVTVLSLPGIIAAIGLFRKKEWARILTLIISVFDLVSFPIGTAIGVYSIWVLSQPETIELFKNS
ncbi:hypothetical protein [Maribellus sp. YY47]|uniref:hypothetical protein n=1 Tax=Maribellus sp. YY47 TaxID=2929486 RepID=UPI0020019A8A|nr:hypothetical protein [Maribellus sp. YY47]MCK3685454.1 hypothetical protein [Maribellus sp. YY47]